MRRSLSFKVSTSGPIKASSVKPGPLGADDLLAAPVFGPSDLGHAGIAERASRIADESVWDVLGLPEGASVEAVRAAYFRLAKVWHPDRLEPALAPFSAEVHAIFARMTEAHALLTDADARQTLTTKRPSVPITKQTRPLAIREIDAALKRREFRSAELQAQELLDADREDSDALSFLAWAKAMAGDAPEDVLRAMLPLLDRAVNGDCDCDRALYYRAMIQKRLGNGAAALRDFVRTFQVNPKHIDAQREIRIHEMRARKGSSEYAVFAKGKKR